MKTCPFCAEEIQDEAIKCKHCGSMVGSEASQAGTALPAMTQGTPADDVPLIARPPVNPAGRQAAAPMPTTTPDGMTFSHSGQRFVLGYGPDFYGIWDRQAPGPPVMRFPRTDPGWQEAWRTFAAWEPQTVAGTAVPPGSNGMAVASLVLGILGLFFFWLIGIPPILALVFGYQSKRQIEASNGAQGGSGLATAGIVTGWIGIAFLVLAIISAAGDPSSF